jgi:hypothetical protein
MRPEPLDMVSESRCSEHQDQIVTPEARNDLLAVRGEEPGDKGWFSGKLLRPELGLAQTLARCFSASAIISPQASS